MFSVGGFSHDYPAYELEHGNHKKDHYHGKPDHVAIAHLIAIADGKITKPAGADRSCYSGDPDKAYEGYHGYPGDPRDALPEINLKHYLGG